MTLALRLEELEDRTVPTLLGNSPVDRSIRQAVDVLAKGGRVAFTGVPTEGDTALPMQKIVLEEIDLFGVRANRNTMEEVIPLIVSGRVRVKPLVTHRFCLEDYGEALNTFANRVDGALKVLVKP